MTSYLSSAEAIKKIAMNSTSQYKSNKEWPAHLLGREILLLPPIVGGYFSRSIKTLDSLKDFEKPEDDILFFFNGVERLVCDDEKVEQGSLSPIYHSHFSGYVNEEPISVFLRTENQGYHDFFKEQAENALFIVGEHDSYRKSFKVLRFGEALKPATEEHKNNTA